MILLITGPQASGKGTQAELLSAKLDLVHLSTGQVLREAIDADGSLGELIKGYVDKGALVPDSIIMMFLSTYLTPENLAKGIIFDGFPRIEPQLNLLEETLAEKKAKIDRVIFIDLSEQVVLDRLMGRLICDKCGANFNLKTLPPKEPGICDRCGGKLIRRSDEGSEAIKNRLKIYEQNTRPLFKIYKERGILEKLDGDRSIEVIFEDIIARLKKAGLVT